MSVSSTFSRREFFPWLAVLSGCSTGLSSPPLSRPASIVASTGMVGDLVRELVPPSLGEVITLIRPGVDPHLYRPTRADLLKVLNARLIFSSGLHLEGRMDALFERADRPGRPSIAITSDIPKDLIIYPDDHSGRPDPHVWMDVSLWRATLGLIARTLKDVFPQAQDEITRREAQLSDVLARLDKTVEEMVASIPEPQRLLVTSHDAFAYFSRRYHIPVESIQGVTTDSEPGVADIDRLVDIITSRKLPAIFTESSVNDRGLRAVVEGVKARGHELILAGPLYTDALGEPGSPADTYVGMMLENARQIASILGGSTAPLDRWTQSSGNTHSSSRCLFKSLSPAVKMCEVDH
ncbi:metal ABC transporter solute-binding protein, Zn/Mn family [Planctopirus limnophila]|nr:zinc ABC transporter substrate-binding protein [Planctopirus limnophila]